MIKKTLIILLIASLIIIFTSCKTASEIEKETNSETTPLEETTQTIQQTTAAEEPEITEDIEVKTSVMETTEEETKKEFSPSIIGSISIFGFVANVYVEEDYAYVGAGGGGMGLTIIDIKDKSNPILFGMLRSNSWWRAGFYIKDDIAYFPNEIQDEGGFSEGSFQIIDISDKNSPDVLGTVKSEGRIKDVWVTEDYAYATYEIFQKKSGIQIINVEDKKNPMTIGIYDTGILKSSPLRGIISSIRTNENYLYVLVGDDLKIMDISDRENIVEKSSYPISKTTLDFYVEGNYLFLPFDNSLQIIDISDEENPIMASDILSSGEVTDVFIDNNNAFITYVIKNGEDQVEKSGIQVIDVLDKNNPILIAELDIPGQAMGIFVEGDYAYVGAGPQEGLQIIKLFND